MGYALLPFVVLSFFLGILAIERTHTQDTLPSTIVMRADQSGQTFVSYRNAVAVFQKNNPTFTGPVTSAALAAQGNSFSPSFLASAGNAITSTGVAGRVITCYAALNPGALKAAKDATENDASLGMASGGSWTSVSYGSTAVPLATTVPDGNVVSVVKIGS